MCSVEIKKKSWPAIELDARYKRNRSKRRYIERNEQHGRMTNGEKLERTGRENEQKQLRDSAVSSIDTCNTAQHWRSAKMFQFGKVDTVQSRTQTIKRAWVPSIRWILLNIDLSKKNREERNSSVNADWLGWVNLFSRYLHWMSVYCNDQAAWWICSLALQDQCVQQRSQWLIKIERVTWLFMTSKADRWEWDSVGQSWDQSSPVQIWSKWTQTNVSGCTPKYGKVKRGWTFDWVRSVTDLLRQHWAMLRSKWIAKKKKSGCFYLFISIRPRIPNECIGSRDKRI